MTTNNEARELELQLAKDQMQEAYEAIVQLRQVTAYVRRNLGGSLNPHGDLQHYIAHLQNEIADKLSKGIGAMNNANVDELLPF